MKKSTQKAIGQVKVLGMYGKKYRDESVYPFTLRKLAKDVKGNKPEAIAIASLLLSEIVTPGAVLIPVPQSDGKARYTLELANSIREIRKDCRVYDILSGECRDRLYDIKKTNPKLKGVNLGFKVVADAETSVTLRENKNIFLVDNVLATGFTYRQATKALDGYVSAIPSILAIGATSRWTDIIQN